MASSTVCELITPPAAEPVSLAEAQNHLRVEAGVDDAEISRILIAARKWCEQQAQMGFVTQSWRQSRDEFPPGLLGQMVPTLERARDGRSAAMAFVDSLAMELEMGKAVSIDAVRYLDFSGAQQLLTSPADYDKDLRRRPARIFPAYGKTWPGHRVWPNAVEVDYTVGVAANAVDERAKQAVLLLAGHWYSNREAVLTGTISKEIELALTAVLGQLWDGVLH